MKKLCILYKLRIEYKEVYITLLHYYMITSSHHHIYIIISYLDFRDFAVSRFYYELLGKYRNYIALMSKI